MSIKDSFRRAGAGAWRWGALPASLALLAGEAVPAASAFVGGAPGERADAAVWASQAVVNGAIALAIWSLARPRLEWRALPACLAFGSMTYANGLLIGDGGLHGAFLAAGLYPEAVRQTDTGFVNPQYAMLAVALAVLGLLAARVAFRHGRTFDRVVVLVACLSVAATTALFHAHAMASVSGMRATERSLALAAVRLPAPAWPSACADLAMTCVEHGPAAWPDVSGSAAASAQARSVAAHALSGGGAFEHSWHGADSGAGGSVPGYATAARLEGAIVRIAHSQERPSRFVEDARVAFAALALPAHLAWLLGAYAVCAFHARLPAFRARRLARCGS